MAKLYRQRRVLVALVAGGVLVAVLAVAYVYRGKGASQFPEASAPGQRTSQLSDQADANEYPSGESLASGRFGWNRPAAPPVLFMGRPSRQGDGPDLSTPAAAMHTILSLVDAGAADKLPACVLEETDRVAADLYPRYVGQPVGLVEVVEDGESATVVWEAAVHTEFSWAGRHRSAGETITLTAKLVRVEGLWKLLQLHERDVNDAQQDKPAN